jgi:uncharacterized OB-fold protein
VTDADRIAALERAMQVALARLARLEEASLPTPPGQQRCPACGHCYAEDRTLCPSCRRAAVLAAQITIDL